MADSDTDLASEATEEKPKLSLDVAVEKRGACQLHVTVTVPRPDIDRYFKEAFDEFQPKAEVPGFRPGRAPRKLVESRFKTQMKDQVKGTLLSDSVSQISEESEFSAISEPDLDFEAVELPDDGPMTFEFDIEVRPEFDLPEWKGLQLTRPVHEYDDLEVEYHLKRLLRRHGQLVAKDGPAEIGDTLTLHIRFLDGEELVSELPNEGVELLPKLSFRDATVESFGELLSGTVPEDRRQVTVRVSDHAEREELRGRQLEAQFEVLAVRQMELPALTSAFLDRIGGFENEDDLREAVRDELERQFVYHQQRRIRTQIGALLTRSADWELPKELLRRQAGRELERAVLELRSSGFSEAEIRAHQNEIRQNSLQSTEQALKEHFILERIAEEEQIDVEPGDYDKEIRLIAEQSDESPRRVRARLEKRGQMDALRNQIVERKVIGLITQHAVFADAPFEPQREDTSAIDRSVGGRDGEAEIPEAKYSGETEELPGATERE